ETLRRKIYESRAPLRQMLGYLQQAAGAVAKAHASGVVHRDLKPDNMMITWDGYAKVLDFGLAKLIEKCQVSSSGGAVVPEVTQTMALQSGLGVAIGTIGYMSPEQGEGRLDTNERSDVFSFGCILYEAATGKKPFTGEIGHPRISQLALRSRTANFRSGSRS